MKYKLGQLVTQYDEINQKGEFDSLEHLQGINSLKFFQECKSNKNDIDLNRYRICRKGMFAYNRATSRNGERISIAYRTGEDCLISPSYYCFSINEENTLLPEYLDIWFKRPVFDKYARFNSWGSATEFFTFEDFCETEIDLPPIEEQRKIVHDYKVITDRIELLKKINENLEEQAFSLYNDKTKDIETTCKIIDLGEFVRGKNITSDEMIPGKYEVVSAGLEPSGMHNEFNVKGPSISISASGVNAGFVSYHFNDVWAADCSYNNDSKHLVYLLCSLKHIKEKIETLKDGHSAQPHVYCKDVNQFDVPLISDTALKEFELVANTIYQNIKANSEEIKRLQELSTILTLKIGKEV